MKSNNVEICDIPNYGREYSKYIKDSIKYDMNNFYSFVEFINSMIGINIINIIENDIENNEKPKIKQFNL